MKMARNKIQIIESKSHEKAQDQINALLATGEWRIEHFGVENGAYTCMLGKVKSKEDEIEMMHEMIVETMAETFATVKNRKRDESLRQAIREAREQGAKESDPLTKWSGDEMPKNADSVGYTDPYKGQEAAKKPEKMAKDDGINGTAPCEERNTA
jgi:hypothetical protein